MQFLKQANKIQVFQRNFRHFGKLLPKADINLSDEIESQDNHLSFVKKNPMLKQVLLRKPDDNLFPKVKAFSEYQVTDINELVEHPNHKEIIAQIIQSDQSDPLMLKQILLKIFDKDFENSQQIFKKLEQMDKVDSQSYNQFIWSAANFDQMDILDEHLSSGKFKIELQVYIKCVMKQATDYKSETQRTPDFLKNLYETEKVSEMQFKFAQSILQESVSGTLNKYQSSRRRSQKRSQPTRRAPRRNSDDEIVDIDYSDIHQKWDGIQNSFDISSKDFDPMSQKFAKLQKTDTWDQPRADTYNQIMSKASSKLKSLNKRNPLAQQDSHVNNVEDKSFEVQRDPLDGNVYLHIEPEDLEKYSSEDIKKISQQFQKHVQQEMTQGELQNLQLSKQMDNAIFDKTRSTPKSDAKSSENSKSWKQIMDEKNADKKSKETSKSDLVGNYSDSEQSDDK